MACFSLVVGLLLGLTMESLDASIKVRGYILQLVTLHIVSTHGQGSGSNDDLPGIVRLIVWTGHGGHAH